MFLCPILHFLSLSLSQHIDENALIIKRRPQSLSKPIGHYGEFFPRSKLQFPGKNIINHSQMPTGHSKWPYMQAAPQICDRGEGEETSCSNCNRGL